MTQRKRQVQKRPAETRSKHERVRKIEASAREAFHIKKVFVAHGPAAAIEVLRELTRGRDSGGESIQLNADVPRLDANLDSYEGSQARRSDGGKATARRRKNDANADYELIRRKANALLACDEDPRGIVTTLKENTGYSAPKIRRALAAHESGHWKPGRRTRAKRA